MDEIESSSIELLNNNNFVTWKVELEKMLRENKIWQHIEEDQFTSVKDNVPLYSYRKLWDGRAKAKLISHISDTDIRKDVENLPTARDIWLKLERIHDLHHQARKGILPGNLLDFPVMQNGDDLRNAVRNYFKIVGGINRMDESINNELFGTIFLSKLPPSFEDFRRAVVSRDMRPNLKQLLTPKQKRIFHVQGRRKWARKKGASHGSETCIDKCFAKKKKCDICEKGGHNRATSPSLWLFQMTISDNQSELRYNSVNR